MAFGLVGVVVNGVLLVINALLGTDFKTWRSGFAPGGIFRAFGQKTETGDYQNDDGEKYLAGCGNRNDCRQCEVERQLWKSEEDIYHTLHPGIITPAEVACCQTNQSSNDGDERYSNQRD